VAVTLASFFVLGATSTRIAALANATATSGGTVTYTVFSDHLCSLPVSPAQSSTVNVTNGIVPVSSAMRFNTVGTYFWNANYSGDTANETTPSSCQSLTVTANGATTIDLAIVPDPVVVRTAFAGSVLIAGTTALASGTVTFSLYSDPTCTALLTPVQISTITGVNSVAPLSASFTIDVVGTYFMNAVYSGDVSNVGSTSACDVVAITKATPSIALSRSPGSFVVGFSTVASTVISNATSNLTGAVVYTVFSDNGCSVPVVPAVTSTKTPVSGAVPDSEPFTINVIGGYFVGVAFAGDSENNAAAGSCVAFSVTTAFPDLTLVLSQNPVEIGESFGAQMTLSANAINPTGSFELQSFTDSNCSVASPDVATHVATLASGFIPDASGVTLASSRIIFRQAVYFGDGNNASAVSDCLAQVINTGQLSASILSATLTPVGYSNFTTTSNGTLVIQVNDDRETGDGWSVTVIASDFQYNGILPIGSDIPASSFSVVSTGAPIVLIGQGIGVGGPYSDANAIGSLDSIRTLIVAEAGFGSGRYQMTSAISLEIPAQSQAGSYTATLAIATSAAP